MRMFLSAIFCAFLIFVNGCSDSDTIASPPKSIVVYSDGGHILAEGRWEKTTSTNFNLLSNSIITKVNSTSITCDKTSMSCEEIVAKLFTLEGSHLFERKLLLTETFTYEIIEWSDGIIKAKNTMPTADEEIKISVKDKFAERSYRANPDIYGHWILK